MCAPGKGHSEVVVVKKKWLEQYLSVAEKYVTSFLYVYVFSCWVSVALAVFCSEFSSMLELGPLPWAFRSCIPFLLSVLTRKHGESITVESWHFLISTAGTSHQQELSTPPCLRLKHNDPQKRGWVNPSGRALPAEILNVFSSLIWVTLLWNTVLNHGLYSFLRSSYHHGNRPNRLISSFFKEFHVFELSGGGKISAVRDRWIVSSLNFLLSGRKDRSYKCCSLLCSIKGILYVQYFCIFAFPPVRF